MKSSVYATSISKRMFDILLSLVFLILSLPLMCLFYLVILIFFGKPVFFMQKRVGKNGKVFEIIKFRTMVNNAEKQKNKLMHLNESDGPTFKIKNDPRFTSFGKALSRTGLDELPQFWNVICGDMSIVGPRPLPVNEANKLSTKDKIRENVRPGVTSSWVVEGAHSMSFRKWMKLDRSYVNNASFVGDLSIIVRTIGLIFGLL